MTYYASDFGYRPASACIDCGSFEMPCCYRGSTDAHVAYHHAHVKDLEIIDILHTHCAYFKGGRTWAHTRATIGLPFDIVEDIWTDMAIGYTG